MKINFKWWTIIFFTAIGGTIALELIGAFTKTGDYMPLTWYIVHYIPGYIAMPCIVAFAAWLIYHFGIRYSKKAKGKY